MRKKNNRYGLSKIEGQNIPRQYSILEVDGYWDRVLEIKQSNNNLTVLELWQRIELELSEFGLTRYKFDSFKVMYYNNINSKIKR